MSIRPLATALLLTTALQSWANTAPTSTLEDGYDAFEQGKIARAIGIWAQLADQGNATAQLNLGQIYRMGNGVEQNDSEAVKWYIMAAQNGSQTATANLMMMEKEGRATREEVAQAFNNQPYGSQPEAAPMAQAPSTMAPGPVARPQAPTKPAVPGAAAPQNLTPIVRSVPKGTNEPVTRATTAPVTITLALPGTNGVAASIPENTAGTTLQAKADPELQTINVPAFKAAATSVSEAAAVSAPRTQAVAFPKTVAGTTPKSTALAAPKTVAMAAPRSAAESAPKAATESVPKATATPAPITVGAPAFVSSAAPVPRTQAKAAPGSAQFRLTSRPQTQTQTQTQTQESWITTAPRNSLVIQLLKSADAESLTRYADARLGRVATPARIVPTVRGIKREYLLLLGPFNTRAQADRALRTLPVDVQQGMPWAGGQPWVRTAESVQRISG